MWSALVNKGYNEAITRNIVFQWIKAWIITISQEEVEIGRREREADASEQVQDLGYDKCNE